MKPDLLTLIDAASGSPVATLGIAAYDGRTVTKRNGERKTMLFSSGKKGFYAGGKVQIDGLTYQCSCSFVEIAGQRVNGPVKSFSQEQIAAMNAQREPTEDELERLTAPDAADKALDVTPQS